MVGLRGERQRAFNGRTGDVVWYLMGLGELYVPFPEVLEAPFCHILVQIELNLQCVTMESFVVLREEC